MAFSRKIAELSASTFHLRLVERKVYDWYGICNTQFFSCLPDQIEIVHKKHVVVVV